MDTLRSNAVVSEGFLCSVVEAMVVEVAIVAAKSLVCSLLMMGIMPKGIDVLPKETDTSGGFPISEVHAVRKPGPENKDASETEDDEDEDEDDDDAVDDGENDGGNDDDAYGNDGDDGDDGDDDGDPADELEANGDGGSEDDDDDDDDDDDEEEEDDDDEDDEEEEEDEEETPQPPAKKRK